MARAKKPRTPKSVYQLKVTLLGSRPPIWRRLLVPGEATLATLHEFLQEAMGWTNTHLHQFEIGGIDYSDPEFELDEAEDEGELTLAEALKMAPRGFAYMYDFGDGWEHEIEIEKTMSPAADQKYPVCIAGARACPPEDCGGIGGYEDFLDALRDPRHREHKAMKEWIGGPFDPEEFNIELINQALAGIKW